MTMHPSVAERLARLAPDQRDAATAPPGPILCVAPAGSGKTTTLVARIAWLVDSGVDPGTIAAITFNRRAAEELSDRLQTALRPLVAGAVRVRTFHALGLEILREAGQPVAPLLDRDSVLRTALPGLSPAERRRLDTVISRLKLDIGADPEDVARDAEAGPTARAFVAYERALAAAGGLDFDDLVVRSVRLLETDAEVLATWRARSEHLLVDEAQDLDRSQLRMALLLAAPANRIFLVGDDDQSIYGWRLADVRRLLGLAATALPDLRRVDLVTNYRCPSSVVARAVRLVERNHARFAKRIEARPKAPGPVLLAPSAAEDVDRCLAILRAWGGRAEVGSEASGADRPTFAILARTNRELLPAVVAALAEDIPFRAGGVDLPVESPFVDELLAAAAARPAGEPLVVRLARLRGAAPEAAAPTAVALVGWAAPFRDLAGLVTAVADVRTRLARVRRDDARLSLATAHATKGLEFDHVAVIGMDEGRFPSARSIADAEDPARTLEEERRLAYVAWTRAKASLILVYDPEAPSSFLREAFEPWELEPSPLAAPSPASGAPPPPLVVAVGVPAGDDLEQPVDRLEKGLRGIFRQGVADGVLHPEGGASRFGGRPDHRDGLVAEAVGNGRQVAHPALGADADGRGQQPVGGPRGLEGSAVDLRRLVTRRIAHGHEQRAVAGSRGRREGGR
jgi:superfamily I DNA/RNA helicase